MAKITANKNVFWSAGGKNMTGRVKQLYGDHAVVASAGTEYIVHVNSLRLKPMDKIASRMVMASFKDNPAAPKGFIITINADGTINLKHIDAEGTAGCSASEEPTIGKMDAIWKQGAVESRQEWNPEIFQQKPTVPPQKTVTKTPPKQKPEEQQEQKLRGGQA